MIVLIDHVFNDYARKIGTHLISNSRDKGTNAPTSPVKKWEETEEESEQSTARRRFNPRARARPKSPATVIWVAGSRETRA